MGTRGFLGFRYKKKYYMEYNPYDSYFSFLGKKLLEEVRYMVKNNKFEEWLLLFLNLKIIDSNTCDDETYNKNLSFVNRCSFLNILNSEYIFVDMEPTEKIEYNYIDGEFFYILDFDKKRFNIKEIGRRTLKYNLFNGELDKVYFEDSNGEDSSSDEEEFEENYLNDVESVNNES